MPSCPKTLRKLRTVWRRSKLKNRIWHSNHHRHIALLKRTHKQVEIGYSVLHKTVCHHNRQQSFATHPDGQTTLLHVTPGFKSFTVLAFLCLRVLFNRHSVDSLELRRVFRGRKSETACHDTISLSCKKFATLKSVLLSSLAHITKKGLCYISGFKEVTSAALVTKIQKTPNSPQADSITDTWSYEIFFRSLFRALHDHGSHRSFRPPL